MEKKKLIVNCATCDVRNITKNLLDAYEEIKISAATLLSSSEANELMAGYPVKIDAASVLSVPQGTVIKTVNGRLEIHGGEIEQPTILMVNGVVEIAKDAVESLKNIVSMQVNGKVIYPSNFEGKMPPMQVNGKTMCYPFDAIRLKASAVIDKIFLLRAKASKYYAEKRVLLLDKDIDLSVLDEKKTSFITKKAYIAASLLSDGIRFFDDETDIEEVPDGCTFIDDDVQLDADTIRKYGSKLLIAGNLTIAKDSKAALDQLAYVNVCGDVYVAECLAEKFQKLDARYGTLILIKGSLIADRGMLTINKAFMEKYVDGVTIADCGVVTLTADVTPEWISEKMQIRDCGMVTCADEQKAAVEEVAEDVGMIGMGENVKAFSGEGMGEEYKVIDASEYVF